MVSMSPVRRLPVLALALVSLLLPLTACGGGGGGGGGSSAPPPQTGTLALKNHDFSTQPITGVQLDSQTTAFSQFYGTSIPVGSTAQFKNLPVGNFTVTVGWADGTYTQHPATISFGAVTNLTVQN
jgi:hypothetical protein